MEWLNQKREFLEPDFDLLEFHPEQLQNAAIQTIRIWTNQTVRNQKTT